MKLLLSAILLTAALTAASFAEPPAPAPASSFAEPPAPASSSGAAGESPKPGVYLAEPFRLLVRVPEAGDELMLHRVPAAKDYSLRSVEPTGRLTPSPSVPRR